MTQREFYDKYSDKELREMANNLASEIVIRSYTDGSSRDERRASTKPEREIISNILVAAFIAYRFRDTASIESICDMAEFLMHQFLPEANAYDTVYWPIKNTIEED